MIRPVLVIGVAAALAGCGAANTDAATVGASGVSRDDYEALLREIVANPELFGVEEDTATGTVPADPGRQVLTLMIRNTANDDFLADAGESVTDEDRQAVLDEAGEDDPLFELSDDVVALFVDGQAGITARGRVEAPDAEELERRYTESPIELGVMCVSQAVAETEAEAAELLAEIVAGDDVATPVQGSSGDCLTTAEAQQNFDPAFVAAAARAAPGEPAGPVQTSLGWEVVVARPYDEIAESLAALYAQAPGELLFAGYLAQADVSVDPRYGRWEGPSGTVVALS